MRSALFLGAVLPLAWAYPHMVRQTNQTDGDKIIAAIQTIGANVVKVNNTLNTFNKGDLDGIVKVLQIQLQTEQLGSSIQDAESAANDAAPLSSTDSGNVAVAVINLQPQVFSLLDNIQAKKPVFDSVILGIISVSPQVEQDLQQQKQYTDDFGSALTAKLDPTYASLAPVIIQQFDDRFDEAIATFSEAGGVIALPPLPSFAAFKTAVEKAANQKTSGGGLLGSIL